MCGITGFINHSGFYIAKGEQLIQQLLWGSALRGEHSHGLISVNKKNEVDWYKKLGHAFAFMQDKKDGRKRFQEIERDKHFIVLHNRYATIGKADDIDYAHPHIYKHIALVHNGTLTHWDGRYDTKHKTESDSQGAARLIAEKGIDEALKCMYGAYVFVYYDSNKNTLNIVRNNERPLGIVRTKDYDIFASEVEMAVWVLKRNKVDVISYTEFEAGKLYTWKGGEKEATVRDVTINTEPHKSWTGHDHGRHWGYDDYGYIEDRNTHAVAKIPTTSPTQQQPVENLDGRKPRVKLGQKAGEIEEYEGYAEGDIVEFHLSEWLRVGKTDTCRIGGKLFGDTNKNHQVRGQVQMTPQVLDDVSTLLVGEITSMAYHKGIVVINVKDIFVGTTVDPELIEEEEPEVTPTNTTVGKVVPLLAKPIGGPSILTCSECGKLHRAETSKVTKEFKFNPKTNMHELVDAHICMDCVAKYNESMC